MIQDTDVVECHQYYQWNKDSCWSADSSNPPPTVNTPIIQIKKINEGICHSEIQQFVTSHTIPYQIIPIHKRLVNSFFIIIVILEKDFQP